MSLNPQGMNIQQLYRLFADNKLFVNRKYQRKLVWAIDEKEKLIDSIIKGLPIPLILFAENPRGSGNYEIIDGLQRLNAIFAYIENCFPYKETYFDYTEFTRVKQLVDEGKLKVIANTKKLTKEDTAKLLEYTLAVTIFPSDDEDSIKDVFGRINAHGKQLSNQEKRQAGSTTDLSNTVRRLACEIRGDVSRDILLLNEMPEISIDSSKERIGYGICAEDTFWVKQGILTIKQLRESEDEQFILDLVVTLIGKDPAPASQEYFDELYDTESEAYKSVEKNLIAYGTENIINDIKYTFSIIKDFVETRSTESNYLRNLLRRGSNRNPIRIPFFTLFSAFFELVVVRKKTPIDYETLLNTISDLSSKLKLSSHYATVDERIQNRDLTIGLIQRFFVDREPPAYGHGNSLALDFENSIRRSKIETSRYEYKQGFLMLDDKRGIDRNLYEKIMNTICGIANLALESDGYVFIGLADKDADKKRIEELDAITAFELSGKFIVGVDRECKIMNLSMSDYVKTIIDKIKISTLTEPLKSQVLSAFDVIQYKGLSIIRISIPKQADISFVGDKSYYRENDNTIEISGQRLVAIAKKFKQN